MPHERSGPATGGHHQNIFFQQFTRHGNEIMILGHLYVIASGKKADAPDVAGGDIIDDRLQRFFGIHFGQGGDNRLN